MKNRPAFFCRLRSKYFSFASMLAALLSWTLSCQASDYRIDQYDRVVRIDNDGRAVTQVTLEILLSTDAAVQRFAQYVVPYNAELQTLSIDTARTLHANGKQVDVLPQTAIFDRPAPVTVSAPQFSAEHFRIVAFPAVAKGDSIVLSYTLKDRETLFPGKFTDAVPYPPVEDYREASVTLDTPEAMPVTLDTTGMQTLEDTVATGRRVRKYVYRTPQSGAIAQQANVLAWPDVGPHFVATNFRDYAEIAKAYRERSGERETPSPTLNKLADSVTEGVSDRREQARRLYDWVSRNIRYVGVYIGAGTVVPRSVDTILEGRYGDCKDHVALFSALLKEKHIDSDSVLVNLGDSYRLPSAPDWTTFNHIITWLPEFDVFADTTEGFAPFGTLSFNASDKPGLDTRTDNILHTPVQNSASSRSSLDYALVIGSDGDAAFTGNVELTGEVSINPRRTFSWTPKDRIEYELLSRNGLSGQLHITQTNLAVLDSPLSFTLQGTLKQIAIMPGPAALAVPHLPNYGSIDSFAKMVLRQKNRPLEGTCAGTELTERYRITLPAKARIIAIPQDVKADSGEVSYRSTYEKHGQTVVVNRSLKRRLASNVCSGEKLASWEGIANVIAKDLTRQVLYK